MQSMNIIFPRHSEVAVTQQEVAKPGKREILCKAEKSLISIGTELRCLSAKIDPQTNWEAWVQYPFSPGYSMAATVLETGAEAGMYKAGDRIAAFSPHAQYFNASIDSPFLQKIPDGITFEQATWMPLGGCITQTAVRRADLRLGDEVGVIGLGMLGQLIVQYLHLMGAGRIVAIDLNAARLKVAAANGATDTLQMDAASAHEPILKLTGGRRLDIVFDVTGLPQVLSSATRLVRKMGKVMMTGDNTAPSQQYLGPNFLSDSLQIIATHGHNGLDEPYWNKVRMSQFFFQMLLQKRMNVDVLNATVHSPMDAPAVYRRLLEEKPDEIGFLFDWTKL